LLVFAPAICYLIPSKPFVSNKQYLYAIMRRYLRHDPFLLFLPARQPGGPSNFSESIHPPSATPIHLNGHDRLLFSCTYKPFFLPKPPTPVFQAIPRSSPRMSGRGGSGRLTRPPLIDDPNSASVTSVLFGVLCLNSDSFLQLSTVDCQPPLLPVTTEERPATCW